MFRPVRLAAILAAATTAGVFAAAGPAQADVMTLPGQNTAGTAGYCPNFAVDVNSVSSSSLRGETVFAGAGSATVTNDSTGKVITYNISGPGKVTSTADGGYAVDAGGPNLFWTTAANSASGVPNIAYITGHLKFSVDASGKTTSYSLAGKSTDVCAALS